MAKKRKTDVPATADPVPKQTPFRPDDPRLLKAIDEYARSVRRSRNMAMVLLLEQALAAHQLWPPSEDQS